MTSSCSMQKWTTVINPREVMNTWTLQMGYPVVTLSRDQNDGSIIHATLEYFRFSYEATVSEKFPTEFKYD